MFARWRGWLFIPSYESIFVGFLKVPGGFSKFPMEFPIGQLHWELRERSKPRTNAFIQPINFHFISRLVTKRDLELMASTPWFYHSEGRGKSLSPPPFWHHLLHKSFNEGLSIKKIIQDSWVNRGGDFIQHEVFQALPEGRRNKKLGHIGAFRYVRLQSTAKIFLAPDHMGGVHNTLVRHGRGGWGT